MRTVVIIIIVSDLFLDTSCGRSGSICAILGACISYIGSSRVGALTQGSRNRRATCGRMCDRTSAPIRILCEHLRRLLGFIFNRLSKYCPFNKCR